MKTIKVIHDSPAKFDIGQWVYLGNGEIIEKEYDENNLPDPSTAGVVTGIDGEFVYLAVESTYKENN